MRFEMNYLNKNNEMEKVDVLGYPSDSGWFTADYCECWTEDRGYFIVPVSRLYTIGAEKEHIFSNGSGYVVKDESGEIIQEYSFYDIVEQLSSHDIGEVLDKIIGK